MVAFHSRLRKAAVSKSPGALFPAPLSSRPQSRLTNGTPKSWCSMAPLLDDGWMDFAAYGNTDAPVGAIEHQLFGVPFVNLDCGREDSGAGKSAPGDLDTAAFRKQVWNATMKGQSVTYANSGAGAQYANSPGAKQMTCLLYTSDAADD